MKKRKTLIFGLVLVGILMLFLFGGKITGMPVSNECTDTDITPEYPDGENKYMSGKVTDITGKVVEDQCLRQQFTSRHVWTGAWPASDCKVGDSVPGGFMGRCDVRESYCDDNGNVKQKDIICDLGACYNGQCACEDDSNCISGYRCVLNTEKNANFCTKEQIEVSEEPKEEPLECIILTYEQCQKICGEYMDTTVGTGAITDTTSCKSLNKEVCDSICGQTVFSVIESWKPCIDSCKGKGWKGEGPCGDKQSKGMDAMLTCCYEVCTLEKDIAGLDMGCYSGCMGSVAHSGCTGYGAKRVECCIGSCGGAL